MHYVVLIKLNMVFKLFYRQKYIGLCMREFSITNKAYPHIWTNPTNGPRWFQKSHKWTISYRLECPKMDQSHKWAWIILKIPEKGWFIIEFAEFLKDNFYFNYNA